jgi:hypothetical protein
MHTRKRAKAGETPQQLTSSIPLGHQLQHWASTPSHSEKPLQYDDEPQQRFLLSFSELCLNIARRVKWKVQAQSELEKERDR